MLWSLHVQHFAQCLVNAHSVQYYCYTTNCSASTKCQYNAFWVFWKRLLSLVQERWWGVLWLRLKWTLSFTQWNKQNSSQGTQSRLEFQDSVSYHFFLHFVNHHTSSHTGSACVTFWNMPMYKMTPTLDDLLLLKFHF